MTTKSDQDLGPCRMCDQPWVWHRDHYSRHAYTPANAQGELRDVTKDRKAVQDVSDARITQTMTPFDPALRLCLIEAGIITIQQLGDAEAKLRAVSGAVAEVMKGNSDEG